MDRHHLLALCIPWGIVRTYVRMSFHVILQMCATSTYSRTYVCTVALQYESYVDCSEAHAMTMHSNMISSCWSELIKTVLSCPLRTAAQPSKTIRTSYLVTLLLHTYVHICEHCCFWKSTHNSFHKLTSAWIECPDCKHSHSRQWTVCSVNPS